MSSTESKNIYYEKVIGIEKKDKLKYLKFLLLKEWATKFSNGNKNSVIAHIHSYIDRDLLITPILSAESTEQGIVLAILGSPAKAIYYIPTVYVNHSILCLVSGKKYDYNHPFAVEVRSLLKDLNLSKYYKIGSDSIGNHQLVLSEDDFNYTK